jgi:hypothetical protein
MDKANILAEEKTELERHVWGTFVEEKASVALGGTGVVVSGCEACRKRFGTNSQYLRHLPKTYYPTLLTVLSLPGVREHRRTHLRFEDRRDLRFGRHSLHNV